MNPEKVVSDYFFDGDEKVILNIRKCIFCKKRQFVSQFYIDCKYRHMCRSCYKQTLLLHLEKI